MTQHPFHLFLFSTDVETIFQAESGGVDGFVVDWERGNKAARQAGFDTQIGTDGVVDLRRTRKTTSVRVICRVNCPEDPGSLRDMDTAADEGADEVLLPMVRRVAEVEAALEHLRGRCQLGVLIETNDAVGVANELGRLPLARAYVGLNDLSISRGVANIFSAVADGTVDEVRRSIGMPFGFGGLTLPDRGHPVPCRLLMSEMARLRTSFSFLRRSFLADTRDAGVGDGVRRVREGIGAAFECDEASRTRCRAEVIAAIADADDYFARRSGNRDTPR